MATSFDRGGGNGLSAPHGMLIALSGLGLVLSAIGYILCAQNRTDAV
jgi:hypothetical protein